MRSWGRKNRKRIKDGRKKGDGRGEAGRGGERRVRKKMGGNVRD